MLGFSAFGELAYSDTPFALVGHSHELSATGGIVFGGSARTGGIFALSASGRIAFGGAPKWTTLNAMRATVPLVLAGSGRLTVAGHPIVITAVPQSYEIRAMSFRYETTAVPVDYTIRGVGHA